MSAQCFSNANGATCCYLTPNKMLIYNELILQIISGNYLSFLGVTFTYVLVLAETTTASCSLEKADPKF